MPFEKITIKVITDHANVIRPTFYNHFHDKYEMMEWILLDEVLEPAKELIRNGQSADAIHHIFVRFGEERAFYKKAFEVTGQNGFAETLSELIPQILLEVWGDSEPELENNVLSKDLMARYYAAGLITLLRKEVNSTEDTPISHFTEAYTYLATHTLFDLM